ERIVYISREKKIRKFLGRPLSEKGPQIDDWVEEVQNIFRAKHMSQTEQVDFIYEHLEGNACEEIRYHPKEDRSDPDRILKILQEVYGDSHSFAKLQKQGEILQEFSHALMGLLDNPRGVPDPDQVLRDQFSENVRDSFLRKELKKKRLRDEAIQWSEEEERVPSTGRVKPTSHETFIECSSNCEETSVVQEPNTILKEFLEAVKKQQSQISELIRQVQAMHPVQDKLRLIPKIFDDQDQPTCFVCRESGHLARNCSQKHITSIQLHDYTGSMVTTITESFFKHYFYPLGQELLTTNGWLTLKAANRIDIPYIGYLELDVEAVGKKCSKRGILVVKDPTDPFTKKKKDAVPGLIGMNVIGKCHELLLQWHGPTYMQKLSMENEVGWVTALEVCIQQTKKLGYVKLCGRHPLCLPARTVSIVPVTGRQGLKGAEYSAMVQPLQENLPNSLILVNTLAMVCKGHTSVPVTNKGDTDVWLRPHTRIASLHAVEVVSEEAEQTIQFKRVGVNEELVMCQQELDERLESLCPQLKEPEEAYHLPIDCTSLGFSTTQITQVKQLFQKHAAAFTKGDTELGCTDLIKHKIPTDDDVPIQQRHRRIPPSQYQEVKSHIQKLLYQGIIEESSTLEEHIDRLDLVLTRMSKHGLKLRLSKCCFFKKEVRYLGHLIFEHGVATDPEKVRAVTDWKKPSTLTELRAFLGFASCYKRFVKGFAQIAAPLHTPTGQGKNKQKGKKRRGEDQSHLPLVKHWNVHCQQAFNLLKEKLTSAPILAYADYRRPFYVEVDASHLGLGAVLFQDNDGKRRPVAYASRCMWPAEKNMQNYSSMKLELLALKLVVTEKFREFLLGNKFTVFTDNNPLSYLKTAKLGAVEQWWVSELALFDFKISYCPGKQNGNADGLSRRYMTPEVITHCSRLPNALLAQAEGRTRHTVGSYQVAVSVISAFPTYSKEDLSTLQQNDPTIKRFLKYWKLGCNPTCQEHSAESPAVQKLVGQHKRISELNGVLYHIIQSAQGEEILQLLLPAVLKENVLKSLHDQMGHQGIDRTNNLVRSRCYWPGMQSDIEQWCRHCERCTIAKALQPQIQTPMGNLLASRPLEILAIDFTLLEPSSDGKENVFIMTDVFSKFTQEV
uniref:Gypsy retrotransposon integrase-like protein 1 n=1 Tax=Latimeria chalumnae TaxID=7897 RepID=H3A9F5_LATCH